MKLQKLNREILDATRTTWQQQIANAEEEFIPVSFIHMLTYAESYLDGKNKDTDIYAFLTEPSQNALALVEINHILRPKKQLRLLGLRFEPQLAYSYGSDETLNDFNRLEYFQTYLSSIIALAWEKTSLELKSDSLKVYAGGNEHDSRELLKTVAIQLKQDSQFKTLDIEVNQHGAWLELKKKALT